MRISFFIAAALLVASAFIQTHEHSAGQLYIEHPWALALPPTSPNDAAYFVVQDRDRENDTLLGANTPCTASAEMREYMHKNDMMSTQKVGGIDAVPGKDLHFAPGSYHLMLMGLKQPLVAGECFPLTLHFRKAGDVSMEVAVESKAPAKQDGREQHGH